MFSSLAALQIRETGKPKCLNKYQNNRNHLKSPAVSVVLPTALRCLPAIEVAIIKMVNFWTFGLRLKELKRRSWSRKTTASVLGETKYRINHHSRLLKDVYRLFQGRAELACQDPDTSKPEVGCCGVPLSGVVPPSVVRGGRSLWFGVVVHRLSRTLQIKRGSWSDFL